jgi:hypothetical protein
MNYSMKNRLVRAAALLIMVATVFLWMLTGCVGMSGPCSAALDMQTRIGTLTCQEGGSARVLAPARTIERITPMIVEVPPYPAESNIKPIEPPPPPELPASEQ